MSLADDFARRAADRGFVVHRGEPPVIEGASVSEGLYGIVETGSVVLAASPAEPRARSLAPTHVTVLSEDRIVERLEDLFSVLPRPLPSALVIVSGPSSSGDVEMQPIVGMHGPAEVHVALVPAA